MHASALILGPYLLLCSSTNYLATTTTVLNSNLAPCGWFGILLSFQIRLATTIFNAMQLAPCASFQSKIVDLKQIPSKSFLYSLHLLYLIVLVAPGHRLWFKFVTLRQFWSNMFIHICCMVNSIRFK